MGKCCCCYHKGTYFQANHNRYSTEYPSIWLLLLPQRYIFSSKSQPEEKTGLSSLCCCCYHKGTYFQANHNICKYYIYITIVVVATTKVHIFKQITTQADTALFKNLLLLLPQRYIFSSKSQHSAKWNSKRAGCCCYHKGTYFQANHNKSEKDIFFLTVVVATTKVHIFKQITTHLPEYYQECALLLLPQRYIFSSKSQHVTLSSFTGFCCCCYHKGTYFQANHNIIKRNVLCTLVVVATTKVHIFKQITTARVY